ncbi:endonuclease [Shewanella sp. BF02_Schw]|uniref:endonuclease n=1 Tax=Shewanella sp. BF02_Schw TaxID=394908 RepID=UPI00177BCD99|nr:endonuclease [Shewanella sp. BF02_Schw]MBO1897625.1 endonuclease [Shewanella sp. BF02_Schw]
MKKLTIALIAIALSFTSSVYASGNIQNESFSKSKKILMKVYIDAPYTFYCGSKFDQRKNITLQPGIKVTKYANRKKVEFEHVVPAQNLGQAFPEWRSGHKECVDSKGKSFKGRNCAEKMNQEYRYMAADMFNLKASIGSVNAARKNYNFEMLPTTPSSFGTCDFRIENRKVQPPESARGEIARTYIYMDESYTKFNMSKSQTQLMGAWSKQFPVTANECLRAKRITKIQGNHNLIVEQSCKQSNLW